MSTVHELEQRIKVLESVLGRGIEHLSLDEEGYLNLNQAMINTPYNAGYITDQYGNFIHSRDIATDNWNIQDNNGTPHIKAYYETGKIFTDDVLVTTDSTGFEYTLIGDNGENLWIGSAQTATKHHTGQTYISSGYSGTNGHPTAYISVPNAANNGATNYGIWHEGNFPKPNVTVRRLDQSSDVTQTGTSYKTIPSAFNYTTKTGRFIAIAAVPLRTSRNTSHSAIMINGTAKGIVTTNSQSMIVTNPMTFETFSPNTTVTIGIGINAQDSGTTATVPRYNSSMITVFDIPV